MGLTCNPVGKFKAVMKKAENQLEENRKMHKNKKKDGK